MGNRGRAAKGVPAERGWALHAEGAGRRGAIIVFDMEPIRTDFRGYEGQYVAIDARSGKIVIADKDPRVVLEKAKGRNHVVARGRVPYADEPIYVGLG